MSSPAPGIRSKLKVRTMETMAPITLVPVSRKASSSISLVWNSHVAIPSSEGGWKRKYLTFLVYSEAGQWRKTLGIALIKQKHGSPPFLDSLRWSHWMWAWNIVGLGWSCFAATFISPFLTPMAKLALWKRLFVHPWWNRGPSSQCWDTGNSPEPRSMVDDDQWRWWWW